MLIAEGRVFTSIDRLGCQEVEIAIDEIMIRKHVSVIREAVIHVEMKLFAIQLLIWLP